MICSTLSGKLSILHPGLGVLVREDGLLFYKTKKLKKGFSYNPGDKHTLGYRTYKGKLVHRLVAECFVPNYSCYETVDHIDRVRDNNAACNLRWADLVQQQRNSSRFKPEYDPVKRLKKREYMRKFRKSRK